jgi:hypothetical protein
MVFIFHRRIYGVDFSGAAKAGNKIWITSGVIEGEALRVEACHRAADLPGSGQDRDRCLAALRDFIRQREASVFGLDFPFGLPRALIQEDCWEDFVTGFPYHYPDPETFRDACRAAADNSELKRVTDRESHTPFSPYNIRLYRQTYFGIRDVLGPLLRPAPSASEVAGVRDHQACVLPMQPALPGRPWVMEICPASTLKRENLYWPYKGKSKEHYAARARILEEIERKALLSLPALLRTMILEDPGGDALDSVVAAFAVFRALRNPGGLAFGSNEAYALEGYVYI